MTSPNRSIGPRLALAAALAACVMIAGCDNSNVNYGVGVHGGSYGWGSSFSVGISNHHYRRPRGP